MNLTLTGFMGTGKTTVGKELAKRLGWQFVDVDRLIESSAAKSIPEIFAQHGEAVFRRLERRLIKQVTCGDEQVIATGGGAFVDPQNRSRLRAVGPVVCLTATPKAILQRVGSTLARRPMLAPSDPRSEATRIKAGGALSRIEQLLRQRAAAYSKADLTIETTRLTIDEIVERIWDVLGPWIPRSWCYLVRHTERLCQRYGGKYVVVMDDRIVSVGVTQLQAFQGVRRTIPSRCEVGIYYIPSSQESPIAL